eukprot:g15462.t1
MMAVVVVAAAAAGAVVGVTEVNEEVVAGEEVEGVVVNATSSVKTGLASMAKVVDFRMAVVVMIWVAAEAMVVVEVVVVVAVVVGEAVATEAEDIAVVVVGEEEEEVQASATNFVTMAAANTVRAAALTTMVHLVVVVVVVVTAPKDPPVAPRALVMNSRRTAVASTATNVVSCMNRLTRVRSKVVVMPLTVKWRMLEKQEQLVLASRAETIHRLLSSNITTKNKVEPGGRKEKESYSFRARFL